MFNSFKCILLCNRTATKFHNHFYITSVCHNHGREGEMRNLPGVVLSSRLPRLSRAQGFFFFGHFSRDHPTRSSNMKQWRNNEVFITPFLIYSKKKFVIPSDYSTKKDIISWTPNFRYTFSIIRETTPRFFQPKRIFLPLGLTGILEYHYPLPTPTARCPGSRTKSSQK